MKILGIDPRTGSFDLCLLDEKEIRFEESILSTVVAEKPEDMAEKCPQFESCRGCLARTMILLGDALEADPSCPLASATEVNLAGQGNTRVMCA